MQGQLPHNIEKFREQYGDIVRLDPDKLSFTNPTAWREI
jgi:hypothetical protein